MSADLFAEFSQASAEAAPTRQPAQPLAHHSPVSGPERQNAVDFGSNSNSNYRGSAPPNQSGNQQQWSSWSSQPAWSSHPTAAPQTQNVADEDDGWGDFEVAEPNGPPSSEARPAHQQPITQTLAWSDTMATQLARMPVASNSNDSSTHSQYMPGEQQHQEQPFSKSSSSEIKHTALWDTEDMTPLPKAKRKNPVQAEANDPAVLFDAADFELEDGEFEGESDNEFGDFETANPVISTSKPVARGVSANTQAPTHPPIPSMDLLSLDDPMPLQESRLKEARPPSAGGALRFGASIPAQPDPKRSSAQDLDFTQFETQATSVKMEPKTRPKTEKQPKLATPTSLNDWGTTSNDDEWAAWDDVASASISANVNTIDNTSAPSSWDWDSTDIQEGDTATSLDSTPPPVNVPPPSVLLSLFPELLSSGSALFRSTSGQSSSIKERILADPKAVQFIKGYILLATTAARIIAGRKHRWHRDKILAKSMSISAAGSKGMKLAGVDRTQAAREDREAADVAAVWREQVGRLRSAVAAANTAAARAGLVVPELSETLSVHTARMVGTAPRACVICGLKRDERIAKVDFEVEDSFGEWWVEHWGHRACKNFWIEHEKNLRQR